jgi:hypothetical protein
MKKIDRRRFLIVSAVAAASLKTFAQTASGTPQTARLALHVDQPGPVIPANFVGLSYETQQLSIPEFFSPANTGMVAQFRELTPSDRPAEPNFGRGILRLGGNTSDYAFWKPTPGAVPPPRAKRPYVVGDPPPDLIYDVTPEAVRNLRGFLDATDWKCIYGINFGTNTPELAADEAAFVSKTLGPRLHYLQVGNEADRFGTTIRDPKTWNADTFFDEWLTFANAIRARVPDAHFGLPDTAGNPEWYAVVVNRLLALPEHDRPYIAALTHHYYFTGPPSNPKATIANLLQLDPQVDKLAADIRAAASRLTAGELLSNGDHRYVPYRMTEGNTCYRGGKPGLSDVFAASLWAADYLLKLASLGYYGVNLHGGDGQMVANSLGGKLPGDELVHDDPANHPHPYYTPIAHIGPNYIAEPVSFGIRFAQQFAGATIIPHDFDPGPANATAYAAKFPDGRSLVAIINKDTTRDLEVKIEAGDWAAGRRLTADSLTSTSVRFEPTMTGNRIVAAASAAIFHSVVRDR